VVNGRALRRWAMIEAQPAAGSPNLARNT